MTDFSISTRSGYPCWSATAGDLEVRFVGRGRRSERDQVLRSIEPDRGLAEVSWVHQTHSAHLLAALPGQCGEGDALQTGDHGLPLCITTADCVPILLATTERVAAVHAGWRGLVAELPRLAATELSAGGLGISAWIGPAIGPCCYEVGPEVAREVAHASRPGVVSEGARGRPHLDLVAAAVIQLRTSGVSEVSSTDICTRCNPALLWSFRRDGRDAGRNLSFIWRRGPGQFEGSCASQTAAR